MGHPSLMWDYLLWCCCKAAPCLPPGPECIIVLPISGQLWRVPLFWAHQPPPLLLSPSHYQKPIPTLHRVLSTPSLPAGCHCGQRKIFEVRKIWSWKKYVNIITLARVMVRMSGSIQEGTRLIPWPQYSINIHIFIISYRGDFPHSYISRNNWTSQSWPDTWWAWHAPQVSAPSLMPASLSQQV